MTVQLGADGLHRLAAELANLDSGLRLIGERARDVVVDVGAGLTFGPGRVRLDAAAVTRGRTVIVAGTPPGPWVLFESGSRKTAWLEPRAGSRRRLRLADGRVRTRVIHGPVRGKRTFTRAAERIRAEAPGWLDEWVTDMERKAG